MWRVQQPAKTAYQAASGRRQAGKQMIHYGDFLVDEQSQIFTPEGEPIWVTNDGRYIPLTKMKDEHLAAIQDMLRDDVARWGPWSEHVVGEITRRAHEERQQKQKR